MIRDEHILTLLRFTPEGQTTAQLAARLKARPETVSSRLSKMAMYGRIDRQMQRAPGAGAPQRWAIWRPK